MTSITSPIKHYTPHLSPIIGITDYTSESSADHTPRPPFRLRHPPSQDSLNTLVCDESLDSDDYSVLSPLAIENMREEMRQMYEEAYEFTDDEEEDFAVPLTSIQTTKPLIARHPRVLLAYLRFLNLYNELAEPDEKLPEFKIDYETQAEILHHKTVYAAPREFTTEVNELRGYVLAATNSVV